MISSHAPSVPHRRAVFAHFRGTEVNARFRVAPDRLIAAKGAVAIDGFVPAGSHEVVWQGRDEAGRMVPSGVYFYRFEGPGFSDTKQMVLLK